ncbi:hypothetical protein [Pedosphaera parvula]|uniref:Bacterial membrane protein YfhO n=1 Tax=Pedosphaera parvula (strain Ellin514) TaxID=320771 RepID=B9XNS3_PEDPL|nr:hypothetical protein [Pedosphaera parvula]EEF58496.1 hypothetical protein Cflav_PD1223 [Pedosphaera parvula Ellin514]
MILSETKVSTESSSATHDLGAWFTPGRFAALLGILLFATFPEIITGQATFFYRDFGVFTYPTAFFHRQSFWNGEVPLWNPLNNCGIPFLAQWNTSALYPPSLFYLLLPLSWSLGVFCVGHLFLAGMGMYFLAYRWTGNRFAAAVAGVAFAYNGLSWHLLMWVSNLAVYAWMPWVVFSVQRAWREGGRQTILAGLAGAMQMLGGAPELILQTWLFIGLLWLLEFAEGNSNRSKMIVRSLGLGCLVGGLSAAQLLPFMDLLSHSQRDTNYSDAGWAMPLSGPANFLVPLFHCFAAGHGVFVQYEQYWTASHYVGIGVVALALLAAWKVRDKHVWLLSAVTIFSILISLGTQGPIYTPLKTVLPQLGFMRYPIKFVVLAVFALPLLCAYSMTWIQTDLSNSKGSRFSIMTVGFVLLGLVGWIIWSAQSQPMIKDNLTLTFMNAGMRSILLILILGVTILFQRATLLKKQLILGTSLLVLLWVDIYTHAPNLTPTVPPQVYEPDIMRKELMLNPKSQVGEPRVMPRLATIEKVRYTSLNNPKVDYLCRRLALYDNCNLLDEIPKTDGFYSLLLRDSDQVAGLLLTADAQGWNLEGLKDYLGIGYINSNATNSEKFAEWLPRKSALPLITAGQQPIFADGTNILRSMFQPEFNPRAVVFLPTIAKSQISATNASTVKLTTHQLSATRLQFEVDAKTPALVSVAQSFYHPWHAYVDDQPVTLWKGNFAFQVLEVPAGNHSVRLEYKDRSFQVGALISVLTLFGSGIAWLWFGKRPTSIASPAC